MWNLTEFAKKEKEKEEEKDMDFSTLTDGKALRAKILKLKWKEFD